MALLHLAPATFRPTLSWQENEKQKRDKRKWKTKARQKTAQLKCFTLLDKDSKHYFSDNF